MCGLAGGINAKLFSTERLLASLSHRGPDGHGRFSALNVDLFHTRLAIQDLSEQATQPMHCHHLSIIFNGEIYNHLDLREKVRDYPFKTRSDTETILALFERFGPKCLEWMDGMFALAILNQKQQTLFLARDRVGKKPLFYYQKGQEFLFASELNALLTMTDLVVDDAQLTLFLRTGFFPDDGTPYEQVSSLPPSSYVSVYLERPDLPLKIEKYFNLHSLYYEEKISDLKESKALIDQALHTSVRQRLESSDKPVGIFLSGGIDSSLITAIASSYQLTLSTFTVSFEGGYDESHLAALVAKRYSSSHHKISLNMSRLCDDVEGILARYGRPFMDSSAIPSFYVSRAAKESGLSVVLNGDGADELFAGYRRYLPVSHGWIKIAKRFSLFLPLLPLPQDKRSLYNYLYRLLSLSHKRGLPFYLSATTDIFEDSYAFPTQESMERLDRKIREILEDQKMTHLSRMLSLDATQLLLSDLLPKMDIATMANSLEARSPFLGKELLELAPRIQDDYKIFGKSTKFILRELGRKYLPQLLLDQPKRGFEVPLRAWVDGRLKGMIYDSLGDGALSRRLINPSFIDALLNRTLIIAPEKRAKILWTLFSLEVWHRNYQKSRL